MIAISLFDYTGNMLQPWHEAGYECHIFDKQHRPWHSSRFETKNGCICHYADLTESEALIRELESIGEISFLSCFPPCDDLAVSGARWLAGKGLRALEKSIAMFATCVEVAEYLGCPYMIENPKSTISTYWRPPDYKFHPCHYSGYVGGMEDYTKETWIWCGNGFFMPPRERFGDLFDPPDTTYIHHQPPGEERSNIRSATPMGFAKAVFQYNGRQNNEANRTAVDTGH